MPRPRIESQITNIHILQELRLADYLQGRRYGNGSNQPGAFGANTSFGSMGNANTSGGFGGGNLGGGGGFMGATNNTTSAFGANNQATSNPFGAPSGGTGLFAPKPAGGGLFGAANNATTSSQSGGGLFGTAGASGFGAASNTGFGTGSALGGANNANNQQPTGLNFGGAAPGANTGFGATANPGGFGTSNPGGLFGSNAATTASPFGGGQQQQTNPSPFGAFSQNQNQNQQNQGSGSLFGPPSQSNESRPGGGLFGASQTNNATGGIYGAGNNQTAQNPNPFNQNASASSGGGLFGAKPLGQPGAGNTAGSGGLFGNANNNAGSGGLFGGLGSNTQSQPNQGSGLFGGNNQNQPKPGGLFGNSLTNAPNNSGNSFLGGMGQNLGNTQAGGGLFGANNQNQPQPTGGGLFGGPSIFGNSQQNQQQSQQPPFLSTSINDIDPYGSVQLFNGLSTANAQNTGPIATPLSSAQKLKKSTIIPHYKINPSASSRLITPQKRGYGFSYSSYSTPGSATSSLSSPMGMNGNLFGSSIGRSLGKSLSTSNLRRSFDSDDSVLAAGAFSASGNRHYGSGSLKKLVINRSLRSDLFSPPAETSNALTAPDKSERGQQANIFKKRVSFDSNTLGGDENRNNTAENLPPAHETNGTSSPEEQSSAKSSELSNGTANEKNTNGSTPPEMEQVKGNELAVVHEDGSPPQFDKSAKSGTGAYNSHTDQRMGDYWMSPSKEELRKMSRDQLKKVTGFQVGRHGCGFVAFSAPVDLTMVDIDNIYDNIVAIVTRSCTVYPDDSVKPEVGKGLNVPSRVTLENSWPRSRGGRKDVYETSGPRYEKHLIRLKRVVGTNFESYDPRTGVWIFNVDHFTTYAMDYDDDDVEDESGANSTLTTLGETPTLPISYPRDQQSHDARAGHSITNDVSMDTTDASESSADPDDTFAYKTRKPPPGAFDEQEQYEVLVQGEPMGESFLGERSMGSASENGVDEPIENEGHAAAVSQDESVVMQDQEMAGSFPDDNRTMEQHTNTDQKEGPEEGTLVSFLGSKKKPAPQSSRFRQDTPLKARHRLEGDWTEHLQRTISPRKQDRRALRELQAEELRGFSEDSPTKLLTRRSPASNQRGFHTSIDLMNSLFGQSQGQRGKKVEQGRTSQVGFEV